MDSETTIHIKSDHILFEANSSWTIDNAKKLIDTAKSEADKGGFKKILFNLEKWETPESNLTRYVSGEYLSTTFFGKYKVAAFTKVEHINKLGENVAVNRGANYRIFSDKHEAEKWLLNDQT